MKAADVRAIFDRLKEVLIPLVDAAAPAATPQVKGTFPAEIQRRLSLEIVKRFGFDETGWRLDTAPHPFAQSLATQDIRITTREPEDSLDGLFATMHECGHGLYEAGVDPALERTLLARGASLGLHESQSRLWENLVGRSRPFWSWFYPRLQETFPSELGSVDEETWFRSINDVRRGLIRIEADEASYNLHIILRFELEQRIMDGLDLRELPDVWNESMSQYLGVDVPNDARRRAAGRALVARRLRLLPDVLARQRDQRADLGAAARGRRRRGRADRARRVLRDSRVAARERAPARAEVHAGRDARARGRRADRPRAVPRLPAGEARRRMIERVCVAGAGVIGSLFAGHLA